MRTFFGLVASATVAVGLMAGAATAMPLASGPSLNEGSALTLVADGCGPFGHRSHYGFCKSNGGPAFYGPPRVYGGPVFYGRRCFVRETYYGTRRICR